MGERKGLREASEPHLPTESLRLLLLPGQPAPHALPPGRKGGAGLRCYLAASINAIQLESKQEPRSRAEFITQRDGMATEGRAQGNFKTVRLELGGRMSHFIM